MNFIMVLLLEQVSSEQTVLGSNKTMTRKRSQENDPRSTSTTPRADMNLESGTYANSSLLTSPSSNFSDSVSSSGSNVDLDSGSTLLFPDHQLLMNRAKLLYSNVENKHSSGFICCPTVYSLFQPISGVLIDGSIAQLYQNSEFTQSFVIGKCARLRPSQRKRTKRLLRSRFRCQQQLTYTYAVFTRNGRQVLNYMRVPSHCTCVLYPKNNRRRSRQRHITSRKEVVTNSEQTLEQ